MRSMSMEKFIYQIYSQLEDRLVKAIIKAVQDKIEVSSQQQPVENTSEWMNLKTAAKYLGVSETTFYKFRVSGLKILEVNNVKRVSKTELDRFIKKNSN